jgi:hypothetical protein
MEPADAAQAPVVSVVAHTEIAIIDRVMNRPPGDAAN